ncbi:MAG: ATP-binding protein [Candidatus Beckwithbacteria bacterium]|nr:ATP-binding protein [Patescibacteria group bacterium]
MYIKRVLENQLRKTIKKFPILGLVGPRQSGKTTLLQEIFNDFKYVNLEDIELREFANNDPKGFLYTHQSPLIIDEAQRSPKLFSQLQVEVDNKKQMGSYILSGSQNFLMMEGISQSLAGRISIQTLLPLSYLEITALKKNISDYSNLIFQGQYPRMYHPPKLEPNEFYNSYLATYIERDLRKIINVTDLSTFQRFLRLCAGRVGQILNLSSLAQDTGITHNTARSWLSVLESSYIIYLLQPYYKNFNKRLIKSPKIYFYDTGLASWLLNIEKLEQVGTHFASGGLFENLVISEYLKNTFNQGKRPQSYFWRDQQQREIDLIIDRTPLHAIEIKSGKTISSSYFTTLKSWGKAVSENKKMKVVYGGNSHQKRSDIEALPWNKMREAWL